MRVIDIGKLEPRVAFSSQFEESVRGTSGE